MDGGIGGLVAEEAWSLKSSCLNPCFDGWWYRSISQSGSCYVIRVS